MSVYGNRPEPLQNRCNDYALRRTERQQHMKKFIPGHILGKLIIGLIAAEIISLIAAIGLTFFVVKPSLEEQTLEEAKEDGARLADSVDSMLDDMCLSMEYLCTLPEFEEALEEAENDRSALEEKLNEMAEFTALNIRAAAAYNETLGWVYSDNEFTQTDINALDSPSMLKLGADNTGPLVGNMISSTQENDTLNIGMAVVTDSGEVWRIVALFDTEDLKNTITDALSYDYTGFEIAKAGGMGFFSGGESSDAHELLKTNTDKGDLVIWDDTGLYVITQTEYDWRICGYISNESFASAYMPSLRNSVLLCLMMFVLSLAILIPLTRKMLKPIKTLRQTMTAAADGDLDARADIKTKDELHDLGEHFNNMMQEIKIHTDDAVKLKESEQNLHFSLLTSQVNYHFIYNAMSTINSLARKQDYEKIIELNSALAQILQGNMLVEDSKMTCTLAKELEVVENYWTIEQISKKGNAQLLIECDEELKEVTVPKNILQPLVENSIRHGIVDEESGRLKGKVEIRAFRQEDFLYIRVADNGRGIDKETLKKLESGLEPDENRRHIGIANIRKRLGYIYGEGAGLDIISDSGTVIIIRIPM